jgi:hypothetical protein
MDGYGRLIPASNRFPSGFQALGDYIHSKGLKFGIHIMRGIPRRAVAANLPVFGSQAHAADIADTKSICRWNGDMYGVDMAKPGAQDYYDSILKLYVSWGVDYIKADDIATPLHAAEIEALHRAIVKTGRAIVLSLSPGPADLSKADFYAANANLWRVSDDFWDLWKDLRHSFDLLDKWSAHARPGSWPDADMLPLGRIGIRAERGDDRPTRFTRDEQRTMMTLWCMARSPLMFGGDLPSNDDWTLSLLNNDEVLAPLLKGKDQKKLWQHGDTVAWVSNVGGRTHVALFNIGEQKQDVLIDWKDLGLTGTRSVRDLWSHKELGKFKETYSVSLNPHAAALITVR